METVNKFATQIVATVDAVAAFKGANDAAAKAVELAGGTLATVLRDTWAGAGPMSEADYNALVSPTLTAQVIARKNPDGTPVYANDKSARANLQPIKWAVIGFANGMTVPADMLGNVQKIGQAAREWADKPTDVSGKPMPALSLAPKGTSGGRPTGSKSADTAPVSTAPGATAGPLKDAEPSMDTKLRNILGNGPDADKAIEHAGKMLASDGAPEFRKALAAFILKYKPAKGSK